MGIKEKHEEELKKQIEFLKSTLVVDAAGRIGMIERVKVDSYGSKIPLKALGIISKGQKEVNPQGYSETVEISLHDVGSIKDVQIALSKADLGTVKILDKKVILVFPPLTLELIKEELKKGKESFHETEKAIRIIRKECFDDLKEIKKNENLYKAEEKKVENLISKYLGEAKSIWEEFESKKKKI